VSDKPKHPAARARVVAEKIVEALKPVCMRIEIAGSLRRNKPLVGDIEILYIPKNTQIKDPLDLFGDKKVIVNAADVIIHELIQRGSLAKRLNVNGSETWGDLNKHAVASRTGIPVDFFATSHDHWFNSLVFRTGSLQTNIQIATAAKTNGYRWNPYGFGFEKHLAGEPGQVRWVKMNSERDVFDFCGLPYLEPTER
jgi:DNA polymerase/3'-5' exonuclease PolX